MTLAELIARYRTDANDKAVPYFVTDDELRGFFNDAEREAALRGRLIHESASASMCQVAVTVGRSVYPLHAKLYELDHCAFRSATELGRCRVQLVSSVWLDANVRDWRDSEGVPQYAVQGDKSIRLVPMPTVEGMLLLEGYRLPKADMESPDDEPEINAAHHIHLVQWALHRAFSIPDTEFMDPARASSGEDEFTRYFGLRPNADLRRLTREDVPHHVEPFWP